MEVKHFGAQFRAQGGLNRRWKNLEIHPKIFEGLRIKRWRFPFAGLANETIQDLIAHASAGWDLDLLTERIASEVKDRLPEILNDWRGHSTFAPHSAILERAGERFQNGDYVSCSGLLFPRIEGILRTNHTTSGAVCKPSPDNLTDGAVASKIHKDKCLLLPHRFARYLREVYFASFNPVAQSIDVARHSVAHGVADASNFNQKSAVIGILVVHHLFYCLEQRHASTS